jgi:PDZ domain-containing secreted protein
MTIERNGVKEIRELDLTEENGVITVGDGGTIHLGAGGPEDAPEAEEAPKPSTYLGIAQERASAEVAAQLALDAGTGLVVREVAPESPAALAGLQKDDVLAKLDDQTLKTPQQLQKLVAGHKPGDTVRVVYYRDGKRSEAQVKLAQRPAGEAQVGEAHAEAQLKVEPK